MWPIIAVSVIFGARFWSLYEDAHTKYMQISMKSSVISVAQMFYNIGYGFTEENSSKIDVYKNEEFSEYRFSFPDNKKILNLRFDPLASSGHVEIRKIRIIDGLGNVFLDFNLKQLVPANQIKKIDIINDHISIDMDTKADDPQIHIRLEEPLQLTQEIHPSYHKTLFLSFSVILLSVLLIYLWVNWNDEKNIKKWICYGLIGMGFVMVTFYCLQTCLGILNQSIPAVWGGGYGSIYLYGGPEMDRSQFLPRTASLDSAHPPFLGQRRHKYSKHHPVADDYILCILDFSRFCNDAFFKGLSNENIRVFSHCLRCPESASRKFVFCDP